MTLKSYAQELFAVDPASPASQLPAADTHSVSEVHHHHHFENEDASQHEDNSQIEVSDPNPDSDGGDLEISIILTDLPGAPPGTEDPKPMIEVAEEPLHIEEVKDENDVKKGKNEKWDWAAHGPNGFVAWIKSRIDEVPKHSGYDSAGLERACAYFEKLDNEISKAMRLDLDGELDANKVETVRAQIDEAISRLQSRSDKVKDVKKTRRKKKSEYEVDEDGFIKEAQKITGVQGVYVTVPLLISRIARVCINGTVSAGHDLNWIYNNQVKKFKLNEREQAEVQQLLEDMGMPIRQDRGYLADEDIDISDSDNFDWIGNFTG